MDFIPFYGYFSIFFCFASELAIEFDYRNGSECVPIDEKCFKLLLFTFVANIYGAYFFE